MHFLTIDLIIDDPTNDEYVALLVENGPWTYPLEDRLRKIQERLYNSFDAIVDGHLAAKFPQSKNRKIRIQVDSYDLPPKEIFDFVKKFATHLENDSELKQAIADSPFLQSLRVINGADLGRCKTE